MSGIDGAGASPAEADSERMEIDRIKALLRGMVRDAVRNKQGRFFAQGLSKAGEHLLDEIGEVVKLELAAVAKGEEDR